MKQEHEAYERDDDELLDQLFLEVVHRALDKTRSIVGRYDLDPRGKTQFELLELGLHRVDCLQRILTRAHDDNAAGDLTLAVQLGNAAPHFGANLDACDVTQAHRDTGVGGHQRNLAEI